MRVPEDKLDELREKTLTVAASALEVLRDLHEQGTEFKKRHSYPSFDAGGGTYRAVSWSDGKASPIRYQSVFGDEDSYDTLVPYSSVPGVAEFLDFVEAQPDLCEFLYPQRLHKGFFKDSFLTTAAMDLPLELAQRHIHLEGWQLNTEVMEAFYEEVSPWWIYESLPVLLMVPILGVDFDIESLVLDDRVELRRLSEKEQLTRWPGARLDRHKGLIEMATHALFISGWNQTIPDYPGSLFVSDPPDEVDAVDQFFRAMASISDAPSGYVQVITVPDGWARGYTADLPPMEVTSLISDRCSTRLEPGPEPLDLIEADRLAQLKAAYLAQDSQKSIRLASERLVSAERRTVESDRIVDLCIGLEALLSDAKGETTYKIAVRGSIVLARTGVKNASEYYRALKRIYGFRSAVVHGSSESKQATVSLAGETYRSEDVARVVLRRLVLARVMEPSLSPEQIDAAWLVHAVDRLAAEMATTPGPGLLDSLPAEDSSTKL